jgi:hypothetical protein
MDDVFDSSPGRMLSPGGGILSDRGSDESHEKGNHDRENDGHQAQSNYQFRQCKAGLGADANPVLAFHVPSPLVMVVNSIVRFAPDRFQLTVTRMRRAVS